MSKLRKVTKFEPCGRHAAVSAASSRRRLAEVVLEGGWASPCGPAKCLMLPGTDFYVPDFVDAHPVFTVGDPQ